MFSIFFFSAESANPRATDNSKQQEDNVLQAETESSSGIRS